MRKKNRNPASKESSGLREKAKGGLPEGALVFFNKLGRAGHFGPFHGSNRRRSSKQMIALDLNHFGFQWAGRPERRKGQRRRRKRREEKSQTRANLNGDEVDCEDTSGIPRVVRSGGGSKPGPT